ncbi:MICOS complex subunit MIC60, mitochondrial [Silene latifolia]|uniref:MICOS complex subunit MIC60, mitochondrial n=1 Tax=Silene latifolia TaxID=37657 RepID=UPI003D77B1D0
MFRRSILALSHRSRSSIRRLPKQPTTLTSPSLCFRRDFSSVPPGPGPTNKPSGSGGNFSKILVGSAAIGACFAAAYSGGYLNDILGKKQQDAIKSGNTSLDKLPKQDGSLQESHNHKEPLPEHTNEDSQFVDSHVEETKDLNESQSAVDPHVDSSNLKPTIASQVKVNELPTSSDDIEEKREELGTFNVGETSKHGDESLEKSFEDTAASADRSSSGEQAGHGLFDANEKLSTTTDDVTALQVSNINKDQPSELKSQIEPKDLSGHERGQSPSLLSTYSLNNEADERDSISSEHDIKQSSVKEEISHRAFEDKGDGKLIVDFLQAIHAAEQRQAELDALVLAEEKRAMKDKYEKELKDARARELMYAEEAAMLEKEIKKERAKAAAALKSLQERAEERLKTALEEKEREVELKLKELEDFAKAELAASIAREKAAQIERMAEANLNINALCMAFYARSEEARQTHSIHKLALGALALEDALSNGLPVQAELNALGVYIEDVDKDSLLQLAVSSLPEDVRLHGTDSVLNLNQKFNALKGSLRHFSLISPDGGGILTHSLARVASFLKVKNADQSGDGIESVINKVEGLLAAGKLVEAADVLEDGVKGSKATEVVSDWLRRVRNRAIAEQALVLLQSYATSMSLT